MDTDGIKNFLEQFPWQGVAAFAFWSLWTATKDNRKKARRNNPKKNPKEEPDLFKENITNDDLWDQ